MDVVFNLGGQVSHIDSMRHPQTDLASHCRVQPRILEARRRPSPGVQMACGDDTADTFLPTCAAGACDGGVFILGGDAPINTPWQG